MHCLAIQVRVRAFEEQLSFATHVGILLGRNLVHQQVRLVHVLILPSLRAGKRPFASGFHRVLRLYCVLILVRHCLRVQDHEFIVGEYDLGRWCEFEIATWTSLERGLHEILLQGNLLCLAPDCHICQLCLERVALSLRIHDSSDLIL